MIVFKRSFNWNFFQKLLDMITQRDRPDPDLRKMILLKYKFIGRPLIVPLFELWACGQHTPTLDPLRA